jgi:hypothetical protein
VLFPTDSLLSRKTHEKIRRHSNDDGRETVKHNPRIVDSSSSDSAHDFFSSMMSKKRNVTNSGISVNTDRRERKN